MRSILEVYELTKRYGETRAVDGISFAVPAGSVFTILGPNGAGKTTTMEMLEGIREPDSGEMVLFGERMKKVTRAAKRRMGVLLQDGGFEPHLRVREVIQLFSSFFPSSLPVDEILDRVALREKAGAQVRTLSGGQRQRMAVGVALVNDPDVVFLDEPTTGLDPQARRSMWEIFSDLQAQGKTILLTTHYMEEAEVLSSTVCIMDHGRIIAQGGPHELTASLAEASVIEFQTDGVGLDRLQPLRQRANALRQDGMAVRVETSNLLETMATLLEWAKEEGA
ncbi:MAG TPA: ABC transporter ATP-binding protein, partial [Candidatus Acetothermia bacterium]|nr:ABC transporter ATP-binding protein [Candidatus Acetothermia bacterium]